MLSLLKDKLNVGHHTNILFRWIISVLLENSNIIGSGNWIGPVQPLLTGILAL